jgi:hypothetical protein
MPIGTKLWLSPEKQAEGLPENSLGLCEGLRSHAMPQNQAAD